jgi:hypothetical protein
MPVFLIFNRIQYFYFIIIFLLVNAHFLLPAHIFFDDAFELSDVSDDWMQVNEFVKLFAESVNEAGAYVHQVLPDGSEFLFFGKKFRWVHWRRGLMVSSPPATQGCQMVSFQTKNPNLSILWRALECKMLAYFMAIWNIYSHLVFLVAVWYILW